MDGQHAASTTAAATRTDHDQSRRDTSAATGTIRQPGPGAGDDQRRRGRLHQRPHRGPLGPGSRPTRRHDHHRPRLAGPALHLGSARRPRQRRTSRAGTRRTREGRADCLPRADHVTLDAIAIEANPSRCLAGLDCDVVVVGARGHNPISELLLGSVPTHLARHCHRPVVIVPHLPSCGSARLATRLEDHRRDGEGERHIETARRSLPRSNLTDDIAEASSSSNERLGVIKALGNMRLRRVSHSSTRDALRLVHRQDHRSDQQQERQC
jgi:hypothetical protein